MKHRPPFVLAVAIVAVVFLPVPALAHAGFVSATPTPGATLGTAPGQVTLTFSEPENTRLSRVTVRIPDGSSVTGRVVGDDGMVADLSTSQPGVYEVSWTTVSVVDGHTLSGSFAFGVGVSPGAGAEGTTVDDPTGADYLIAVARVIEDTSLLLLVGLLLLSYLARRQPEITWVRTPTVIVFAAALAGGGAVVIGEALRAAPSRDIGSIVAYLTTGVPGWARSARVALEAAGLIAALRWSRLQAPLVFAALLALAAAGHAAAVTGGVAVEAVHLFSAGVWAGGVMALAFQRPVGGLLGQTGRPLLDRFTPPALTAFTVTVGTGVIRGVQEVGAWAELVGSTYGIVLLLKAVFVVLMAQLSFVAWRRIAVFARSETTLAVFAIAAAALLSAFPLPPARQAEAAEAQAPAAVSSTAPPIPTGGAVTLGDHAGAILVGLTISPAKPGPNKLTVYVQSLDGPQATAALPVDARVDGKDVALTACSDTCRQGRAMLTGGERVVVDIDTANGGRATFQLPTLPAPSGEQLLQRVIGTMDAVTSYRMDETLTSGLGTTVSTTYAFAAPTSVESHVDENGKIFDTVWIGGTRYMREGRGAWKVQEGGPPFQVPTYIWDSFAPYRDVRIVGRARVAGVATSIVAFAGGDDELPVWLRLWVDDSGYVRQAKMRAPGHFMDERFHDFGAAITIRPPKGAPR